MPQATGALTKLLGLTQSAFKQVPVSPDAEILYVRTYDYAANQPLENDPTLAGGLRGNLRGERGRVDGSGSAVVTLGTSIGDAVTPTVAPERPMRLHPRAQSRDCWANLCRGQAREGC